MQARKSLIVGGNGALGRAMITNFRKNGWKAVSLDLQNNDEANSNVIVNKDVALKNQVDFLLTDTRRAASEYDAIVCVAGGFGLSNIKDFDIFAKYEEQDRINFQSALLAGHFATQLLAPRGFLMFTGAAAVFEGPVNYAYAYAMSKSATHTLALQMSKREEIPDDADVCTILPQVIDTAANREGMPDADFDEWAPPDKIAALVRQWAEGENRPINGSYAKLEYKNGSVFPTFV